MKKLDIRDIKNKTLANLGYKVNNIEIKPKSLYEIIQYGEKQYYMNLNILLLNKNSILKDFNINKCNKVEKEFIINMSDFDFLALQYIQSEQHNKKFSNMVKKAISYIFNIEVDKIGFLFSGRIQNINRASFRIDDSKDNKLINNNNFKNIQEVLRIQNVMPKEEEANPFDNNANELVRLREKMRNKVRKSKAKTGLQLQDIISIVASNNDIGLNIINIYNINMFMLQNQLQRIAINENYSMQKYLLGNSFGGGSIDFKTNTYLKKL